MSLNLKRKKKMGGKRRAKKIEPVAVEAEADEDDMDVDEGVEDLEEDAGDQDQGMPSPTPVEDDDADDPQKTIPLTRYNAMLAIVKNTLFMWVMQRH